MDVPSVIRSLFSEKDQDVMAIHYPEDGQIKGWRVERLKRFAEPLRVTEMKLTNFYPELRIWFGDSASSVALSELVPHVERILAANLAVPIIVVPKNRIVDGAHRYIRALLEKKEMIPCKVILQLPDPDIVIPVTPDGQSIISN